MRGRERLWEIVRGGAVLFVFLYLMSDPAWPAPPVNGVRPASIGGVRSASRIRDEIRGLRREIRVLKKSLRSERDTEKRLIALRELREKRRRLDLLEHELRRLGRMDFLRGARR